MSTAELQALEFLAANVRRHRLDAGLTQAQLAEHVGVEPRFMRSIEAAKRAPSFKTLVTIARALHVEIGELFVPAERVTQRAGRPRARTQ